MSTDELQYLLDFNFCISQCIAKSMEHLSYFCVTWRDSYLAHMNSGIKQDTLSELLTGSSPPGHSVSRQYPKEGGRGHCPVLNEGIL